ncbi:serine/threonine-protein kinase [Streptomyces sp. NPDC091272]|uniref:serine/threonine-protein kinase n=1 Tax=Streptomyces sp. NPDC091272 TaxID=3365981 RepID=UPI0038291024
MENANSGTSGADGTTGGATGVGAGSATGAGSSTGAGHGTGAGGGTGAGHGAGADSGVEAGRLLAGRYRLGGILGSGGMGRVWRAHDEMLHRTVAVKELRAGLYASEADRAVLHARTQKEARAAARINHPGVVTVHDVLDHDDRPWIVMEYVDGPSLADALKDTGPRDAREAARIGLHVLGALRAAHAVGVLHRDVKPGNVMLARDGRVLLTDFGIAAIEGDSTITRTGELVGSLDYLAPERIHGEDPGPASDLWALGATLYTAVEERSPFRRTSPITTLQAVVSEDPSPTYNAGALGPVIGALLQKQAGRRPTAAETERMLLDARSGRAQWQPQPQPPTRQEVVGQPRDADQAPPTTPVQLPSSGLSRGPAPAMATPAPGPRSPAFREGGERAPEPPTRRGKQGRRRGRTVLVVLVAAVIGSGAAFGIVQYLDRDGSGGSLEQPADVGGQSQGTGGTDPQKTPDQGQDAGKGNGVPAGWHREKENGFSLPVPDGWERSEKRGQLDYTRNNGRHRIRVSVDEDPDFASPYEHLVDLESGISKTLPEFERLRLEEGVYRDRPSGLLEFTYTEKTDNPGKRYALDQMHFEDAGGTEYALYVSGPLEDRVQTLERFKTVLRGWRTEG